jgi:glycosyltransferase involved in cell wall biosynthesis
MALPSAVRSQEFLSVIIPVRNAGGTLEACLRSIRSSWYSGYEIIVVDDHSTDDSVSIAHRFDCTVISLREATGANAARNEGAKQAKGTYFLFLDADVVVTRDTLLTVVELLRQPDVDAVVGLYSTRHRHESFVSQYKNLWVRYSYLKSPPVIDWLFGAISGIKREAFEAIGGFDETLIARHGNDDIEFGKRLAVNRLRIHLSLDVEVEHLKNYTLASFVRNEFERSKGFVCLARRFGEVAGSLTKGFANVYPSFILSVPLAVILPIVVALVYGEVLTVGWLYAAGGAYFLLNIRFINYLEQVRGLFALAVMIPILYLDHLVCAGGVVAGLLSPISDRSSKSPAPTL